VLYCVRGSDFYLVDNYELLGIGFDTGKAVFEPLFKSGMTVWETKFLAAYGLSIIKKYVDGCGGPSHIYLFTGDDLSGAIPLEIKGAKVLEDEFTRFEEAINPLLLSFASFGNEFPPGTT
jgi:hypothetical protein